MNTTEFNKSTNYKLSETITYIPKSVVIKSILKKVTGTVSILSFDSGEVLLLPISPFDNLIHIIDGEAEIIIDEQSFKVTAGHAIIIPSHAKRSITATTCFKMVSTIIKSGYEDIKL